MSLQQLGLRAMHKGLMVSLPNVGFGNHPIGNLIQIHNAAGDFCAQELCTSEPMLTDFNYDPRTFNQLAKLLTHLKRSCKWAVRPSGAAPEQYQ